ncbi:MAG: hypothetical protein GF365_02015 [Candidatus Buchananbacteria bacterium]|nr:hypothetical protein [Candidatus Buchananbacteria bacterium]
MKKWLIVEAVMVVAIIFLVHLIKIQLIAEAHVQDNSFELLVQTENGLVPYSQIKIVKIKKPRPVSKIQNNNQVIYAHRQSIQFRIYEIEPELGKTLIQLAHCESSLNPEAVGDNGNSYGLYQIYLKWHPDVNKKQAQDIEFATKWTANKIRQGKGDLWTCWNKI